MDTRIQRGQILKDLRIKKGLKQLDLAAFLEITQQAYQRYECGTSEPNADGYRKLADFYGVTTDYLLGREPAPDPFSEMNLSTEDEQEVFAKYMSLPENVRAIMLNVLLKLGDAARARQAAEPRADITETTTAGDLHDRLEGEAKAEEAAG